MMLSVMIVYSQGVEEDISDNDDFAPALKKRRGGEANWQLDDRRNIECTACAMPLKKREVLRHPQFGVCMCKRCIKFLKSATFLKVVASPFFHDLHGIFFTSSNMKGWHPVWLPAPQEGSVFWVWT
jgi:hypothetical protein